MLYEIFKFELQYRAKRLDTYLFFGAIFLFSLVAFDFLFAGQPIGQLKENAPYLIAKTMTVVSIFFMVVVSMIMGTPVLRDFEQGMDALLFVNPISKRSYLAGRFLGSFTVLLFVFSGLVLGMALGEWMPWRDPSKLLPFSFGRYLWPFFTLILPSLFCGAGLFFLTGSLSRKMLVVYTQGLSFFLLFMLSMAIDHPLVSCLIEPFGYQAISLVTEGWDTAALDHLSVPLTGILGYNRLFWVGIGMLSLAIVYHFFEHNSDKKARVRKSPPTDDSMLKLQILKQTDWAPQVYSGTGSSVQQFLAQASLNFRLITAEAAFWAVIICALVTIGVNSIQLETSYDVNSYPLSYLVVEELQELSIFFFLIILVAYSGEVIWKERSLQFDPIYNALPVSDLVLLGGKLMGLLLTYGVILLSLILFGIVFQMVQGYYNYELGVYFGGIFGEVFLFLLLFTLLSFFFQSVTNSKYMGHLFVLFTFVGIMVLELFGYGHPLLKFGADGLGTYSAMNGHGHAIPAFLWGKIYWLAIGGLLFVGAVLLIARGPEASWRQRWHLRRRRFTRPLRQLSVFALLLSGASGSYIFHNTNILNTYYTRPQQAAFRVAYEQNLKSFEHLPQPKIVAVDLEVELYPQQRAYTAEGYYILENQDSLPITAIHLQKRLDEQEELIYVKLAGGAQVDSSFLEFGYTIHNLTQALLPGDSLRLNFRQTYSPKGFPAKSADTEIVHNGTFFNNDRFPSIGYNPKYELDEADERKQYSLPPKAGKARRDDPIALTHGRTGGDGSKINFAMRIGTDSSQIALAPGQLHHSWLVGDRRYYDYRMHQPMINMYAVVSARYTLRQDHWLAADGRSVDLEIYAHPGHDYNLASMMSAMKKSLSYCSQAFSPYPYQQLRIMEFPRYREFAQSFPGTIPYSEAMGFIMNIEDDTPVNIPFFVTAHEVAHQWWGMQLVAANVQGRHLILESLAQYTALMILRQTYGEAAVQAMLKMEEERYLEGKRNAPEAEVPLALVEGEDYIYYRKGAINMYALQDCLTEARVNEALHCFLADWNMMDGSLQQDRYPTSADLIGYFRAVAPDSLKNVITELLEE